MASDGSERETYNHHVEGERKRLRSLVDEDGREFDSVFLCDLGDLVEDFKREGDPLNTAIVRFLVPPGALEQADPLLDALDPVMVWLARDVVDRLREPSSWRQEVRDDPRIGAVLADASEVCWCILDVARTAALSRAPGSEATVPEGAPPRTGERGKVLPLKRALRVFTPSRAREIRAALLAMRDTYGQGNTWATDWMFELVRDWREAAGFVDEDDWNLGPHILALCVDATQQHGVDFERASAVGLAIFGLIDELAEQECSFPQSAEELHRAIVGRVAFADAEVAPWPDGIDPRDDFTGDDVTWAEVAWQLDRGARAKTIEQRCRDRARKGSRCVYAFLRAVNQRMGRIPRGALDAAVVHTRPPGSDIARST